MSIGGFGINITFRDYFDAISRFAYDDVFIAKYLLRRVITLLSQVTNVSTEYEPSFVWDIWDLTEDGLAISCALEGSNVITIGNAHTVDWYDYTVGHQNEVFTKGPQPLQRADFLHGMNNEWRGPLFTPTRETLDSISQYCVFLEKIEPTNPERAKWFVVGLDAILEIFKDINRQYEAYATSTL